MLTKDFDFELPEKFIAQNPSEPRDHSKLLIFDTKTNKIFHRKFYNLPEFLNQEDVLVINRSKVIPARILWEEKTEEREIFLLKEIKELKGKEENHQELVKNSIKFKTLVRPGKKFKKGDQGKIIHQKLEINWEVLEILEDGERIIRFFRNFNQNSQKNLDIKEILEKFGKIPLPPYIKHSQALDNQYQTIYAKEKGSVAAPTAGLHFTKDLFKKLEQKGIEKEEVILHVGRGTFLPVKSEKISDHKMHSEEFELPEAVAKRLNKKQKNIIAVGTTSVRVLESCFDKKKGFIPQRSATEIFIYPGHYQWKSVNKLITNFHLPKSTLIMLVASFIENKFQEKYLEKKEKIDPKTKSQITKEAISRILEIYEIAKENNYRFYSFGDAMLII